MTKNLTLYNASAGSGKTFILSLEYIALCLASTDHGYFKRILAITFTNKAAHELKHRIISFLANLGSDSPDTIKLEEIKKRTGLDERDITQRAAHVHERMLHNYGEIHISTIDSFVLSILRAFSKELGMAFDFEVELDGSRVKDLLVQSIMSQIGKDKFITEQLARLVSQQLDDGKAWDPKRDMKEAIDHLLDEDSIAYREELAALGEEQVRAQLDALAEQRSLQWQAINDAQRAVTSGMHKQGLEISDIKGGKTGLITFAFKDFRKANPPTQKQAIKVSEGEFASPASRKAGTAELVDAFGASVIAPNFWRVKEGLAQYEILDNLYRNRISLILALRLQVLLKKFEEDEGLSVIKDNNFKIAAIIEDNPTPFIYERVGERFNHFLIDEFQDTSTLQWGNMLPLIEGSLAYGHKNFLVGDVKQSIYRWRGGDADQMLDLVKIADSAGENQAHTRRNNIELNLNSEVLENNFRSSQSVIRFNNDLFKFLSASLAEKYQQSYAGLRQGVQRELQGFVQVKTLEEKAKLEDVIPELINRIKHLSQDGYTGSDICILTRSNSDGKLIAKHLELNNHSISSPDSLLLSGHADVQLIMSFIKVLGNERAIDAELFILYRLLERASLSADYHAWAKQVKDPKKTIARLEEFCDSMDLAWTSESYTDKDAFHCLQILCKQLDIDSREAYVQELMNAALSYIQSKDSTLLGFYEFWDLHKDRLAVKAGQDRESIQLMTIHKSKGLQFPVVILPYFNWKAGRKTKKKEWVRPQAEPLDIGLININSSLSESPYDEILKTELAKSSMDELNVLYVALTRAEDRMYIHVSDPGPRGLAKSLLSYIATKTEQPEVYSIGEETKREAEAAESTSLKLAQYETQDRGAMLNLALSRDEVINGKRALGTVLHHILEKASTLEESKDLLERYRSDFSPEELNYIGQSLSRVYELEQEMGWNDTRYSQLKEAEVLGADGDLYRMDKVLIDRDLSEVIVIDYKTGQVDDDNKSQMEGYLSLLGQMEWNKVTGYLMYTSSGELEQV